MPSGRPTEPTNLDLLVGETTIVLSWNPPASTGGSALTGYVVYRGTTGGSMEVLDEVGIQLVYTMSDVDPGITYLYSVSARNEVGISDMATPLSVEFLGRPGSPRDVSATLEGADVKVTWTGPDSDGGSPITGYLLLRGSTNDSLSVVAELGLVTSYVDGSTEPGKDYWYAVRAVNERGPGTTSGSTRATIPGQKEEPVEQGIPAWAVGVMIVLVVVLFMIAYMATRPVEHTRGQVAVGPPEGISPPEGAGESEERGEDETSEEREGDEDE
jgi:hypothetical protein